MFGLLSTLVLAATTVLHAQARLPPNCTRNATVALGNTCDGISAMYNSSTYQLKTANPGLDCSSLYPGEVLCLGLQGHDCMKTYVVQPGDVCWAIDNEFNIPGGVLYKNNPNINAECSNIYPKEVLCVADKVYVNSTQPA